MLASDILFRLRMLVESPTIKTLWLRSPAVCCSVPSTVVLVASCVLELPLDDGSCVIDVPGNGIVLVDDTDFSNWFLSSVISLRIRSVRLWNPVSNFSSIISEVPVVLTIWPINIDFSSETVSNDFCNFLFSSLRVNASAVSSESFAFSVFISFSCRLFFSISFWRFSINVLFSSLRDSDSCRSISFLSLRALIGSWILWILTVALCFPFSG